MLAQNFKTPADLGLTDPQFSALVTVLGMLERGEISEPEFRMMEWDSDCGTAHCLGGWAETVARDSNLFSAAGIGDNELTELFYPGMWKPSGLGAYSSTPAQAAMALRSYLTNGEARWSEALT